MDASMEPIAGVSLQKYAELCAAMSKTGEDKAAQVTIAGEHGVDATTWEQARDGWAARMSDPANVGLAHAFVPLYTAAQSAVRGGREPETLEAYARVVAEYSFGKDAEGKAMAVDVVLSRHGYDRARWNEITGYWTPKVNDPSDPACARFRELMQAESDRIHGIESRRPDLETDDSVSEVVLPNTADGAAPQDGVVGMVMGWVKSVLG
ncbi:MAG: hypothetical protein ABMA64_29375 [Myxococcota bacterium]